MRKVIGIALGCMVLVSSGCVLNRVGNVIESVGSTLGEMDLGGADVGTLLNQLAELF